jgi:hypothetical protein
VTSIHADFVNWVGIGSHPQRSWDNLVQATSNTMSSFGTVQRCDLPERGYMNHEFQGCPQCCLGPPLGTLFKSALRPEHQPRNLLHARGGNWPEWRGAAQFPAGHVVSLALACHCCTGRTWRALPPSHREKPRTPSLTLTCPSIDALAEPIGHLVRNYGDDFGCGQCRNRDSNGRLSNDSPDI